MSPSGPSKRVVGVMEVVVQLDKMENIVIMSVCFQFDLIYIK